MKFRALLPLLACLAAAPACAWSGTANAGDYRVTATLADDGTALRSISLAPERGVSSRPMQFHAWFVDSEGAILSSAPLAAAQGDGMTRIAYGNGIAVPSRASALVVLAQPAGLTKASAAASPSVVAQIALP